MNNNVTLLKDRQIGFNQAHKAENNAVSAHLFMKLSRF